MLVERRERVFAIWLGATGNGRNPLINGRRQPSRGGTSRMTRECQVRFCERLGVQFPGPTRQNPNPPSRPLCQLWPAADITPLGLPPLCAKALNRSRGRVPEAPDTVDPIVGGDALFETKPVALAHDDCVENPVRLPTTTMQL